MTTQQNGCDVESGRRITEEPPHLDVGGPLNPFAAQLHVARVST
ncbi:hypothetical protein [Nocardia brasiliensis]